MGHQEKKVNLIVPTTDKKAFYAFENNDLKMGLYTEGVT